MGSWWSSLFMGLGAFAASATRIFMPKEEGAGGSPAPAPAQPGLAGTVKKYGLWIALGAVALILIVLFSRRK